MALFRIGAATQSPLKIQIGTTANCMVEVRQIIACGDNSSGAATNPIFSFPTTPGSGSGTIVSLDGFSVAQSDGITSFISNPSLPSTTLVSSNLPKRLNIMMPRGCGPIILPSSYGLLFANATGGHTWTGELLFEEF